jgi:Mrp family chromosome partitioning ATPase
MSIVESALQRLRGARGADADRRSPAAPDRRSPATPEAPEPAARARTRIPAPVRWPGLLAPADFDVADLQAAGLAPPERFTRRLRDEFRAIRRDVVGATEEKVAATGQAVGPIVVVTSAGPGEGKSYTALNLALSIAGQGIHDVLLIDADVVRRTISVGCKLGERPGLADLLAHPAPSFFEHCYPTRTPRLRILPAGTRASAAHDLFATARVASLFDSIRTTMAEHVVIVDTAPILVSSDTPMLVDVAGQVLLVVRAGSTLQDAVRDALGHIRKTLPVGVILNYWSPLLPSEKKTYTHYDEYAQ